MITISSVIRHKIIGIFLLLAWWGFSTNAMAQAGNTLFSPKIGVLCDRFICADSQGVSVDLIQQYLGPEKARKVIEMGDFDKTEFTFADGTFCDIKEKLCHVDRFYTQGQRSEVNEKYTKMLFMNANN